jgi:DNA-binding response OmpR family regulator
MTENNQNYILIVEDEHSIARSLARLLEFEGFIVDIAYNGREGIKAALAHPPDLIISDVLMPIMDGITMVGELQRNNTRTPVILYSNLSQNELHRVTKAMDIVACLPKADTSITELLRVIGRAVRNGPACTLKV